ncbi:unnamed protein product [Moneuplotes crassus]|uniref:Uncharacterized protein n=1 Tax=Euplotes crassus TaxID=5936 RepID=A0AAD1UE93_EUPCR|nr:unnamed protein product [Moneuplotes crassus]
MESQKLPKNTPEHVEFSPNMRMFISTFKSMRDLPSDLWAEAVCTAITNFSHDAPPRCNIKLEGSKLNHFAFVNELLSCTLDQKNAYLNKTTTDQRSLVIDKPCSLPTKDLNVACSRLDVQDTESKPTGYLDQKPVKEIQSKSKLESKKSPKSQEIPESKQIHCSDSSTEQENCSREQSLKGSHASNEKEESQTEKQSAQGQEQCPPRTQTKIDPIEFTFGQKMSNTFEKSAGNHVPREHVLENLDFLSKAPLTNFTYAVPTAFQIIRESTSKQVLSNCLAYHLNVCYEKTILRAI